ncbi:MAG: acyltransferase [Bacteroidales bacterium]|nr:acyltransferase [Bacteroidales bacterium]
MREKIEYYSDRGSAFSHYKEKAQKSGKSLIYTVGHKLKSQLLSTLALWIPVSNFRVVLQRLRGVEIGKRVFIGTNVSIDNAYPDYVRIEDDCGINANVTIISHISPRKHFEGIIEAYVERVTVKKGAWVAAGSILLPGVTIGEYSIVSAGSVVSKSVPPYSIVRGNPAKVFTRYSPELLGLDRVKKE